MSGICDTCKQSNVCRKPIGGIESCRLYVSGKESNYQRLFGTPERAARVVIALNTCRVVGCEDCAARQLCMPYSEFPHDNYDALLEWLRG